MTMWPELTVTQQRTKYTRAIQARLKAIKASRRTKSRPPFIPFPISQKLPDLTIPNYVLGYAWASDIKIEVPVPIEPIPFIEPTYESICRAVCRRYGVSKADLLSHRRATVLIRPRHIAMYLIKTHTLRSYPNIARIMEGRDHTTIMNGVKRITNLRQSDSKLDAELDLFRAGAGGGMTTIRLPIPPSLNNAYPTNKQGRRYKSDRLVQWEKDAWYAVICQKPPKIKGPVKLEYRFNESETRAIWGTLRKSRPIFWSRTGSLRATAKR
jgi:hypothetical protein